MEKAVILNKEKTVKHRRHSLTLDGILMFCTGLFSTMPIVSISLRGSRISLFTIFFVLTAGLLFLQLILNHKHRRMGANIKLFLTWLIMAIFSSFIGWLYFVHYPAWRSATKFYLSKIVIYFLFAIVWSMQNNSGNYARVLLQGMLVGAVLNLCWSIIDAASFYIFGVSVNNVVFRQYAIDTGTRFGTVSLIVNGMIRAGGFNDDPAHIGFLAPTVIAYALYKKNGWLMLLSIASVFSSASTTALVGVCVVMLFNIRRVIRMLSVKRIIFLIALVVVVLFLFMYVPRLYELLQTVKEKFFGRIINTYGNINQGGERSVYLFGFFSAIMVAGPMILFGTGFGTASYAYVFNPTLLSQLGEIYYFPYDMEMTYIAYFFDLGIFGFAVFMIMLYRLLRGIRCKDGDVAVILRALCVGMAFSMLLYHFTLTASHVLVTIVGLTYLDAVKKERHVSIRRSKKLPLAPARGSVYAK